MEQSAASLWVVYAIVFIDMFGFGVCMPIVPFLVPTAFWNGLLLASYSTTQALGSIVLGWVADRVGRRPVLLLGLLGAASSYTGFALALQLVEEGQLRNYLLLLARGLGGLFGGTISVGTAYIADISSPQQRGQRQAIMGGVMGLGFVFGPPFGGLLSKCGLSICTYETVFYFSAALAMTNFLFGVIYLKESRQRPRSGALVGDVEGSMQRHLAAAENTAGMQPPLAANFGRSYAALWICSSVIFLHFFCFTLLETCFAFFLRDYLHWDSDMYAYIFMVMGFVMAITQLFITRFLIVRVGEVWTLIIGLTVRTVAFVLADMDTFARSRVFCFLGTCTIGLGGSMANPCVSALITRVADDLAAGQAREGESEGLAAYGKYLGFKDAAGSVARVIGPLVGGVLYDHLHLQLFGIGGLLTAISVAASCALFSLAPKMPRPSGTKVAEASEAD